MIAGGLSLLVRAGVATRHRPPEGATRFQKRGPRAWDNFLAAPALPLEDGGTTRLLVHAVADATSKQWIPKVRDFIAAQRRAGVDVTPPHNLDKALATYLDWMCYGEQRSPSIGSMVFFGLICLLPEIKGKMPLAARSLKSWARLAVNSEGGPIPEEIVFLIGVTLVEQGFLHEGCWILVQYDSYSREQDMEQLWGNDISWDGRSLAMVFGEAKRGESVKTGFNQGVVTRRAVIVDILLALKEHAGDMKVFPMNQERVRQKWHRTMRSFGLDFAGPLHALRHSGPSEDLARGRSTLENVRRRGRWKAMESVQRYTKSFALTRFRAKIPQDTSDKAAAVEKNLRSALLSALHGHTSPLALILTRSLRQRRGIDMDVDMEEQVEKKKAKKTKKKKAEIEIDFEGDADSSDTIGWATD